jgi:hypothetical protein
MHHRVWQNVGFGPHICKSFTGVILRTSLAGGAMWRETQRHFSPHFLNPGAAPRLHRKLQYDFSLLSP